LLITVLVAAALVPLLAALYAPWRPTPAAGLASSLAGLGVAVGYFALVSVFGSYDEEWATKIWTVELGGRSFELWQEYALLFALPASAAGYLLGRLGSRAAPEPAPEAAAGAHPLTPSGP